MQCVIKGACFKREERGKGNKWIHLSTTKRGERLCPKEVAKKKKVDPKQKK